jgi:hypothetical protein
MFILISFISGIQNQMSNKPIQTNSSIFTLTKTKEQSKNRVNKVKMFVKVKIDEFV